MLVYDLYLGRAVANRGDVTDAEWRTFLDDTVTANLPAGYTVLDGTGAWMNPQTRSTISEHSMVIRVALPDTPDGTAAVGRIRAEYQRRFHQQMVGLVVTPACGSF